MKSAQVNMYQNDLVHQKAKISNPFYTKYWGQKFFFIYPFLSKSDKLNSEENSLRFLLTPYPPSKEYIFGFL